MEKATDEVGVFSHRLSSRLEFVSGPRSIKEEGEQATRSVVSRDSWTTPSASVYDSTDSRGVVQFILIVSALLSVPLVFLLFSFKAVVKCEIVHYLRACYNMFYAGLCRPI
jgi:hypothetical protein